MWTGRFDAGKPRGLHGERWRKRPILRRGGAGVHRLSQQLPCISGDSGASGRGINAQYCATDIFGYFEALAQRLRRVRVCCGDWMRILGPSATVKIGVTDYGYIESGPGPEHQDARWRQGRAEGCRSGRTARGWWRAFQSGCLASCRPSCWCRARRDRRVQRVKRYLHATEAAM